MTSVDYLSPEDSMKMKHAFVYDMVVATQAPCPSDLPVCEPLTLDSVRQERPPLKVYEVKGLWATERSGSFNTTVPVALCTTSCQTPLVVYRRNGSGEIGKSEVIRTISFGEKGIGPDVYAVTKDALFLRMYTTDLARFFYNAQGKYSEDSPNNKERAKRIASMLVRLCKKCGNLGYMLGDIKPANVVMDVQGNRVVDMRFIDFDARYTIRFRSSGGQRSSFFQKHKKTFLDVLYAVMLLKLTLRMSQYAQSRPLDILVIFELKSYIRDFWDRAQRQASNVPVTMTILKTGLRTQFRGLWPSDPYKLFPLFLTPDWDISL